MQLLSNDIIRAIGWTLIHSLWQGLVLALVAGILILFTRKSRPALRYNIFTLLFFILAGSAVLTFFYELRQPSGHRAIAGETPAQVVATPAAVALQAIQAQAAGDTIQEPDFTQRFVAYFNEHAPLLVMLWFIVFVARSLWLFGGLVYVQRIRHYKTSIPDAAFTDHLSALCRRIRLNSKVQLLESAMIKVPTALGMLKPVILMPLGMMVQLPPDQVEAVLLHELAHIRRRDFLVNVVQHFAETIFFFNPALLWLSARIREEREHCCDDIAIGVTQSRSGYIQALVSFQEYQLTPRTKYAMAFPGRKKQLLDRVKRILGSNNKTLNIAEKSFLLLCFSLTGMLGFVFSQPEKKQPPVKPATEQVLKIEEKKPVQEISPVDKSAREEPQANESVKDETALPPAEDAAITEPPVDQPYQSQYQPYQPQYQPWQTRQDSVPVLKRENAIMSGTMTTTVDGKQYKISLDNNKVTGLEIDGEKVPDDQLPSRYPIIKSILDNVIKDAGAVQDKRLQQQARITSEKTSEAQRVQMQLSQMDASNSATLIATAPAATPAPHAQLAPRPVAAPKPVLNNEAEKILKDMRKDGLIKDKDNLSFQLNQTEFIVDGKKQADDVFRKYKEKYIRQSSDHYTYSKSYNHTSISISN